MNLRFSTVLSSGYDKDRFLGIQPDAFGAAPGVGHIRLMHPLGFMARPLDPTSNIDGKLGCLAYTLARGSAEEFAYLANDPRDVAVLPPLSQGSALFYNSLGAWVYLDYATESERHYIPYLDGVTKKAHSVTIGKDANGKPSIDIQHGDGMYLRMADEKITLRTKGNASVVLDGDNVEVNGNLNNAGAGSFGAATPANGLVPFIGFEAFVSTLTGLLAATVTPITGTAVATAITSAMATTLAGLKTQYLTAL